MKVRLKYVILIVLILLTSTSIFANTEVVNGVTWQFTISGDKAINVYPNNYATIAGEVIYPATLGGKPVTTLKKATFEDNNAVTRIVLQEGVTEIPKSFCYRAQNLQELVIPSTVTSISDYVFIECYKLNKLHIPAKVTSIGDSIVYLATALPEITIDENNTKYKTVDGVLYTKDGKRLLAYPCGSTRENLVIPEGTETVKVDTISRVSALKTITFPSTMKEIAMYSVYDCNNITDIYIKSLIAPTLIEETSFGDAGREPKIKLHLPKEYLEPTITFPLITKTADGKYETTLNSTEIAAPYNFIVTIDEKPIYVTEDKYTLPESTVEGKKVYYTTADNKILEPGAEITEATKLTSSLYNLKVTLDGTVMYLTEDKYVLPESTVEGKRICYTTDENKTLESGAEITEDTELTSSLYNLKVTLDGKAMYLTEDKYVLPESTVEGKKICYKTADNKKLEPGVEITEDTELTSILYKFIVTIDEKDIFVEESSYELKNPYKDKEVYYIDSEGKIYNVGEKILEDKSLSLKIKDVVIVNPTTGNIIVYIVFSCSLISMIMLIDIKNKKKNKQN